MSRPYKRSLAELQRASELCLEVIPTARPRDDCWRVKRGTERRLGVYWLHWTKDGTIQRSQRYDELNMWNRAYDGSKLFSDATPVGAIGRYQRHEAF
jgi:hypothetical protein